MREKESKTQRDGDEMREKKESETEKGEKLTDRQTGGVTNNMAENRMNLYKVQKIFYRKRLHA